MKALLSILFILGSISLHAQNNMNNRGLIYNKDLKMLVGTWTGNMVYTDPKKNNQQFTLPTKLVITDKTDSLSIIYSYTNSDGMEVSDTSSLRIYDKEDKLKLDGELYDIVSTVRKGPMLQVVGEKQGFDVQRVADLRQTLLFNANSLKIVKEVRFMENEFFFIRNRSTFTKK